MSPSIVADFSDADGNKAGTMPMMMVPMLAAMMRMVMALILTRTSCTLMLVMWFRSTKIY
jgi:hypothetical protein